jgi:hypothetical protein
LFLPFLFYLCRVCGTLTPGDFTLLYLFGSGCEALLPGLSQTPKQWRFYPGSRHSTRIPTSCLSDYSGVLQYIGSWNSLSLSPPYSFLVLRTAKSLILSTELWTSFYTTRGYHSQLMHVWPSHHRACAPHRRLWCNVPELSCCSEPGRRVAGCTMPDGHWMCLCPSKGDVARCRACIPGEGHISVPREPSIDWGVQGHRGQTPTKGTRAVCRERVAASEEVPWGEPLEDVLWSRPKTSSRSSSTGASPAHPW